MLASSSTYRSGRASATTEASANARPTATSRRAGATSRPGLGPPVPAGGSRSFGRSGVVVTMAAAVGPSAASLVAGGPTAAGGPGSEGAPTTADVTDSRGLSGREDVDLGGLQRCPRAPPGPEVQLPVRRLG